MTSGQDHPQKSPSGFRVEAARLNSLVNRWLGHLLDHFFDLSFDSAKPRVAQTSLLMLLFALLALTGHILLHFLYGQGATADSPLASLPAFAFIASLRIVLIIGISSSLAIGLAGDFLADIFELDDRKAAWRFIRNVAFGGETPVLHLREGKIEESDGNSPIVLIGGPGRVHVESDTAALFEKPDGTPHVIGHGDQGVKTAGSPDSSTLLQGFERLREPVISLRDQYIGSLSGQPLTVVGRSLDGIPVSVTDVRGVYSVRRHTNGEDSGTSMEPPYPLRSRDVEDLIYHQAVRVLTDGGYPSGQPGDWSSAMTDLIGSSLRDFMSQNRLSEFLGGVGAQEMEISEFREDTILSKTLQIVSEPVPAGPVPGGGKPAFHPRTELSAKFRKYGSEFSTRAQEHGLELHWIGVGTWKMPDESIGETVNDKYLEAWRMNRENTQRSDPQALERVTNDALLDAKLRLIQEIPIGSHEKNRTKYVDKSVLLECLLQDFWEQLGDALQLLYKNRTRSPDLLALEQAILKVEELLSIDEVGHILGDGTMSKVRPSASWPADEDAPPAPSSRSEAAKYQALLGKLDGNYKVAEAMIANEARRHTALSREELIARIVQRFERHGR